MREQACVSYLREGKKLKETTGEGMNIEGRLRAMDYWLLVVS